MAYQNILRISYFYLEQYIPDRNAEITGLYKDFQSVKFPPVQRIYMTATPDYVQDVIAFEEWAITEHLRKLCLVYPSNIPDTAAFDNIFNSLLPIKAWAESLLPKKIYMHYIERRPLNLNVIFYYKPSTIVSAVNNSVGKEKWLIFVQDKQEGEVLKKELGSSICSFIYSDTKRLEARDEIAINSRFDKKVLIATAVLDNGVSLKDEDLKNIVIDTTDKVQLIQMLGRKRLDDGEEINLYICNKEERYFDKYLKSIKEISRNIAKSISMSSDFENEIIQKEFVGEKYFSFDRRYHRHLPSPYATYYLGRKKPEY